MLHTRSAKLDIKARALKKQNWKQSSNFFNRRKPRGFRNKKRVGWLPRDQWLRKKRFLKAIAIYKRRLWLIRRDRWLRRNKRPFWKRKSFKRFREEQNILNNLFFVSKKQYAVTETIKRKWVSKKILYRRYYRSNSIRRDYKIRIILRHYWKFRYAQYTHNKLNALLLSVKRKAKRLFYFFCTFELVLFRYARWWGLIPLFCSDYIARYFVTHGYIYVNFLPEMNPMYRIQAQDCIFSISITHLINSHFFISNFTRNYGKVKHLAGRREFSRPSKNLAIPINLQFYCGSSPKKKQLRNQRFVTLRQNANQLYLKMRALLQISTWAPLASLHYSLVMETSYKIKIFISISAHNWFTIAFGLLRAYNDVNTILSNRFINYSYY